LILWWVYGFYRTALREFDVSLPDAVLAHDVSANGALPDGAALIRPTITIQTTHYKYTNT